MLVDPDNTKSTPPRADPPSKKKRKAGFTPVAQPSSASSQEQIARKSKPLKNKAGQIDEDVVKYFY